MEVVLAYGTEGLTVNLPETKGFQGILRSMECAPLPDPLASLEDALLHPIASPSLRDVVRKKIRKIGPNARAVIVISDITRPVPNAFLLPPILKILEQNGVSRESILILIATGIHRPNVGEELERLIGKEIARSYRVDNHRSKNADEMADCGKSSQGIPILLNRQYIESDIKILTGFIEPHMWAGYSGGRKTLLPGIASLETMRHMHGYAMVANPGTRYGQLEGNPFHEAGIEVLNIAGADFLVNVTLDTEKRITGLWCGDPGKAHVEGCQFLERSCVVELPKPLDFVVTTNAGAPLDCNLYQTTKGITGAAMAVREGGAVLVAAECPEGAGAPEYTELLESVDSPEELLDKLQQPGFFVPDQWCAQEMCQVMLTRSVLVKCSGLSPEWLEARNLTPIEDVARAVQELLIRYGPEARWAVIPDGPLTITRTQIQAA